VIHELQAMNTIELITPEPRHVLPDVETAVKVVGLIRSRPKSFGVAARVDGRLAGSNFMLFTNPVAGVGPITIDPAI
jgi:hypothetical protein